MEYLLLFLGLILLIGGAELFVRGAVGIAHKLSLSPLVIGLTVLALGTSAPELVVSMKASINGSSGIAIGNVVGSNIANIILVLALTAIINPVVCNRREFIRDYSFMNLITLLFALLCMHGVILRIHGFFMLLILFGFILYNYSDSQKKEPANSEEIEEIILLAKKSWFIIILLTIIGLSGVIFGADLLVKGAIIIATKFGVSEEIIGLTIIAVGTSLPELATSIVAAIRRQNAMALGNIIGSNIWNLLLIIGTTSVIIPIKIPQQIATFDVWVMLTSSLILAPLMIRHNQLNRLSGAIMLAGYVFYIYALYLRVIA